MKVCVPVVVAVTMKRLRPPDDEVARVWDATVLPFSDVIVPPAPPASTTQENVPPDHRSFSVDVLQVLKLAPKRDARVSPPVEDALPKMRLVAERLVVEAFTSVVCPVTPSAPPRTVFPDTVRLVLDVLPSVVLPVTLSVEENTPVVPVIAPRLAIVE